MQLLGKERECNDRMIYFEFNFMDWRHLNPVQFMEMAITRALESEGLKIGDVYFGNGFFVEPLKNNAELFYFKALLTIKTPMPA